MNIILDKIRKNIIIKSLLLGLILLAVGLFLFKKNAETPALNVYNDDAISKNRENVSEVKADQVSEKKEISEPELLPKKILIEVPFTTQAPFGIWDAYHKDACEEAALIMLKYYLDKKTLTPEIAEQEIQKMIAFQIKNYGDYKDTAAAETVKLFNDFYHPPVGVKNMKVIYDFSRDDLKKYLAQGNPIIVPAAGRLLGNPNFTAPGPLYHKLVLVGYDDDTIITNDPGTRKGKNYRYGLDIVYNAIHDFPGKPENIAQGRKAMIILE